MITHLHHINFLVNDLERAVEKYCALLGVESRVFQLDEIDGRGVKIARTKLGPTWLVLVQPIDENGVPAQHLKKHGEGFFLMSLGCDNLDQEVTRIQSDTEFKFSTPARQGLDNWKVRDLATNVFDDVQIQLTEEDVSHR